MQYRKIIIIYQDKDNQFRAIQPVNHEELTMKQLPTADINRSSVRDLWPFLEQ